MITNKRSWGLTGREQGEVSLFGWGKNSKKLLIKSLVYDIIIKARSLNLK